MGGQFDTVLGVTEENLFEAIRSCWASLFGVRALQYRKLNTQSTQALAIAIVVQEMVASDFSGVAFSLNPVTGDEGEILIEGVLGLGESLVSGEVTPNRWRFQKAELIQIEFEEAIQEKGLFLGEQGGSEWRELS